MILLRWPPDSVRPLYSLFLETEASHWLTIFSGSFSINAQRADDTTRHLTAIHPVRSNTGSFWRVCDLEWKYRTWYVLRRMQHAFGSCVLARLMSFQATSRTTCLRFTYRSYIILLDLQRSWAGQRWLAGIVGGKPWRMTSGIEYSATKGVSSLPTHGVRV